MTGTVLGRAILFSIFATLLSGCASFWTRKGCEKTNWFLHGQEIAMRGERVTADTFVQNCERVDANIDHAALSQGFKRGRQNYCEPETVFQIGKKGEFFSIDLCDGDNVRTLKDQHNKGVLEYCSKSNGYSAGATGKSYNNICPKGLENEFKSEFNRGRKAYLTSMVAQTESEIADLESQASALESKRARLQMELVAVGDANQLVRERKHDPITNTWHETTTVQADPARENRRNSIQGQISSTSSELERVFKRRQQLRQKIRELTAEALRL